MYIIVIALTASCVSQAVSQTEKANVAVLDFMAREGVLPGEAVTLTDVFRSQLVGSQKVVVVERSRIRAILEEQSFQHSEACSELECIVEVGKILDAQKMIAGSIGQLGDLFIVTIQVVDVTSARVEQDRSYRYDGDLEGMARTLMPDVALQISQDIGEEGETTSGVVDYTRPDPYRGFRSIGMTFGYHRSDPSIGAVAAQALGSSATAGLTVGFRITYGLSKHLSILALPQYIRKGADFTAKFNVPTPPFTQSVSVPGSGRYGYLEIPLVLRLDLYDGHVRPYLLAGPAIGFLLSASNTYQGPTWASDFSRQPVEPIEYGVLLGAGVEYAVMPLVRVSCDIGYSVGLSNVIRTVQGTTGQPPANLIGDWTSRDLSGTLGISLDIR